MSAREHDADDTPARDPTVEAILTLAEIHSDRIHGGVPPKAYSLGAAGAVDYGDALTGIELYALDIKEHDGVPTVDALVTAIEDVLE